MEFTTEQQDLYNVEISGWDKAENFFVERTSLVWGRNQNHEVCLKSPLRTGSVVFVRLIQRMLENAALPIAFQAVSLGERDENGFTRVKLEHMHPRNANALIGTNNETEIRVA